MRKLNNMNESFWNLSRERTTVDFGVLEGIAYQRCTLITVRFEGWNLFCNGDMCGRKALASIKHFNLINSIQGSAMTI